MLIPMGYEQAVVDDLWAGQGECPHCQAQTNLHFKRVVTRIRVFFIPILSFTTGRMLVYEDCDHYQNMKRKEYNAALKEQMTHMEQFPEEIILRDFDPKKNRLWTRFLATLFLVYLGAAFTITLIFAFVGIDMITSSIRNFRLAKKKRAIYKKRFDNRPKT